MPIGQLYRRIFMSMLCNDSDDPEEAFNEPKGRIWSGEISCHMIFSVI